MKGHLYILIIDHHDGHRGCWSQKRKGKEQRYRTLAGGQSPEALGVLGRESDHEVHVNSPEQVTSTSKPALNCHEEEPPWNSGSGL